MSNEVRRVYCETCGELTESWCRNAQGLAYAYPYSCACKRRAMSDFELAHRTPEAPRYVDDDGLVLVRINLSEVVTCTERCEVEACPYLVAKAGETVCQDHINETKAREP